MVLQYRTCPEVTIRWSGGFGEGGGGAGGWGNIGNACLVGRRIGPKGYIMKVGVGPEGVTAPFYLPALHSLYILNVFPYHFCLYLRLLG